MPDLRGLFLRGYGSQAYAQNNGTTVGVTSTLHASGQLGQIQGDGIRNISGTTGGRSYWTNANSALYTAGYWDSMIPAGVGGGAYFLGVDASRVVPTAPENRPVNVAVRYLVRARP